MAGSVVDENSTRPNEKIPPLLGNQPPLPRLKGTKMKTYKDFKEFVNQSKYMGVVWQCVLYDATNAGFKKWQVWLYAKFYRRTYMFHIKPILKRFCKLCWYIFVCFGLFVLTLDVRGLIKSTTKKNVLQSLESAVHLCEDVPNGCEHVINILKI